MPSAFQSLSIQSAPHSLPQLEMSSTPIHSSFTMSFCPNTLLSLDLEKQLFSRNVDCQGVLGGRILPLTWPKSALFMLKSTLEACSSQMRCWHVPSRVIFDFAAHSLAKDSSGICRGRNFSAGRVVKAPERLWIHCIACKVKVQQTSKALLWKYT